MSLFEITIKIWNTVALKATVITLSSPLENSEEKLPSELNKHEWVVLWSKVFVSEPELFTHIFQIKVLIVDLSVVYLLNTSLFSLSIIVSLGTIHTAP